MIFFKKSQDNDDEEEEEIEYVLFQGATNGVEPDLAENRKLASAGLTAAKELVTDALARKCDMFKLDVQDKGAVASFFIDGLKRPGPRFPAPRANAITQIMKLLAGLDITVRDKPQRGGIKAEYRGIKFELTVKSQPVKGGPEQLTVTFRNVKTKRATPEDIGIPEEIKAKIRQLAVDHAGVCVIVGPPESGLTTAALCTLRCIDSYLYQCYILGSIGNREVLNVPVFKQEEGHTLEHTLERIERNEAAVVYFSDFEDPEIVKGAMKGSLSMVMMSEMYAKDVADGLLRLVEKAGDPGIVAEQVKYLVGHRLIRKLCTKCKEAFRPNPRLLTQVGLPEDTKTLFRKAPPPEPDEKTGELPEPCRMCDGTGFRGRVAIFELLEMTEGLKGVVLSGGDANAIRAQMKEDKMLLWQKDALRLVADGTTGLEELQRVFAPGGPRKKKPAKRRRPPE